MYCKNTVFEVRYHLFWIHRFAVNVFHTPTMTSLSLAAHLPERGVGEAAHRPVWRRAAVPHLSHRPSLHTAGREHQREVQLLQIFVLRRSIQVYFFGVEIMLPFFNIEDKQNSQQEIIKEKHSMTGISYLMTYIVIVLSPNFNCVSLIKALVAHKRNLCIGSLYSS